MRNILFSLLLGCIILSSCKKDHSKETSPVGPSKVQKVTFTVGFSKSVSGFQTNKLVLNSTTPDTAVTNHISILYYMVFDSAGNNVHNIEQKSTDTAFGHYTDNLHSGKYIVAIAGGGNQFTINAGDLNTQSLIYQDNEGDEYPFDQDTFFARDTITVGTTTLNKSIGLNRIVSKLVVNINDQIPTNTANLTLSLYNFANEYFVKNDSVALYPGSYNGTGYPHNIFSNSWGLTNYQLITLFLYNSKTPLTVEIMATDGSKTPLTLADKFIYNITGAPNKITYLSGDVFGGNSTAGGIKVTADTSWSATPIIKTFP